MNPRRLPDEQGAIVDRLTRGERIIGPAKVRTGAGKHMQTRRWASLNGGRVHANAVEALAAKGIVETRPGHDAEREVILRERETR